MQKSALGLALLFLYTLSAFSLQTQRQTALREIIPGHYVFSSGTFNSGLIVTSEGVVVLDALDYDDIAHASLIRVGSPVEANIMDGGDGDYYQFESGPAGDMTVTIQNTSTMRNTGIRESFPSLAPAQSR